MRNPLQKPIGKPIGFFVEEEKSAIRVTPHT